MRREDWIPRSPGCVCPALKRLRAGIAPARPQDAVRSRNRLFRGTDGLGLRGSALHQVDADRSGRG